MKIGIVSEHAHARPHAAALEALGHEVVLLGGDPTVRFPGGLDLVVLRVISSSHHASAVARAHAKTAGIPLITEDGLSGIRRAVEQYTTRVPPSGGGADQIGWYRACGQDAVLFMWTNIVEHGVETSFEHTARWWGDVWDGRNLSTEYREVHDTLRLIFGLTADQRRLLAMPLTQRQGPFFVGECAREPVATLLATLRGKPRQYVLFFMCLAHVEGQPMVKMSFVNGYRELASAGLEPRMIGYYRKLVGVMFAHEIGSAIERAPTTCDSEPAPEPESVPESPLAAFVAQMTKDNVTLAKPASSPVDAVVTAVQEEVLNLGVQYEALTARMDALVKNNTAHEEQVGQFLYALAGRVDALEATRATSKGLCDLFEAVSNRVTELVQRVVRLESHHAAPADLEPVAVKVGAPELTDPEDPAPVADTDDVEPPLGCAGDAPINVEMALCRHAEALDDINDRLLVLEKRPPDTIEAVLERLSSLGAKVKIKM